MYLPYWRNFLLLGKLSQFILEGSWDILGYNDKDSTARGVLTIHSLKIEERDVKQKTPILDEQ